MAEPTQGGGPPGKGQRERGVIMREKCLELRAAGMTYEQIGREYGISKQAAHQHVKRALNDAAKRTDRHAERVRALELHRLDALVRAHWTNKADIDTGKLLLSISTRRAKLEGLDAPDRRELTGAGGAPLVPAAEAGLPDLDALSTEELQQLAGLIAKAGGGKKGTPSVP